MNKEWIIEILDKVYTEFENDTPPNGFNVRENEYNNGLYRGRLKAMEIITQRLTGKSGDELTSQSK